MTRIVDVSLSELRIDQALQLRVATDYAAIDDYARAFRLGTALPPVDVFRAPDGALTLAHGFHRVAAAQLIGSDAIAAQIYDGDREDAIRFAAGANPQQRAVRWTSADAARAAEVLLRDGGCWGWSDRRIAEHCGSTHPTVGKIRARIQAERDAGAVESVSRAPEVREGRDGRRVTVAPAASPLQERREKLRAELLALWDRGVGRVTATGDTDEAEPIAELLKDVDLMDARGLELLEWGIERARETLSAPATPADEDLDAGDDGDLDASADADEDLDAGDDEDLDASADADADEDLDVAEDAGENLDAGDDDDEDLDAGDDEPAVLRAPAQIRRADSRAIGWRIGRCMSRVRALLAANVEIVEWSGSMHELLEALPRMELDELARVEKVLFDNDAGDQDAGDQDAGDKVSDDEDDDQDPGTVFAHGEQAEQAPAAPRQWSPVQAQIAPRNPYELPINASKEELVAAIERIQKRARVGIANAKCLADRVLEALRLAQAMADAVARPLEALGPDGWFWDDDGQHHDFTMIQVSSDPYWYGSGSGYYATRPRESRIKILRSGPQSGGLNGRLKLSILDAKVCL